MRSYTISQAGASLLPRGMGCKRRTMQWQGRPASLQLAAGWNVLSTAFSLASLCSASAQDDAPPAAAPKAQLPQFALMRMAGDGRCLFRALATGAYLLDNPDDPNLEKVTFQEQTRQADELRAGVCQQLLQRREDLEPFIEGDYGAYVARMQQPRVWGGEPELAVAPHVVSRPVSVYSVEAGVGLYLVSQYGTDDYPGAPDIALLFHGGGHYDLLVPAQPKSKL